ncbi:hypothetical protein CCP2SC5_210033 [Azospirillaceae bacterium]
MISIYSSSDYSYEYSLISKDRINDFPSLQKMSRSSRVDRSIHSSSPKHF